MTESGFDLSVLNTKEAASTDPTQSTVENQGVSNPNAGSEPTTQQTGAPAEQQAQTTTKQTPEPPAPAEVFDEAKWIKENLGFEGVSKDQIRAHIERTRDYDDVVKKSKELEEAYSSAYVDDYAKAENDFVRKGGDRRTFQEINNLDIAAMQPIDLIRKSMQINKRHLDLAEINELIEDKYKLGDEEDPDSREVKRARIMLKDDAEEARNALSKYKVEMSTPPADKLLAEKQKKDADAKIAQDQSLSQWSSTIDKVAPDIKTVTIPINDEGVTLEYDFKDVNLVELKQKTMDAIQSLGFQYGENAGKFVQDVMVNHLKLQNQEKIYKAIAIKARELNDAEWRKEAHNPTALSQKGNTSSEAPKKDEKEGLFKAWVDS